MPGPAYYEARDRYNAAANGSTRGTAGRAALFLYLASRSFNGILRVNSRGEFNVPVSDNRTPNYPTREALRAFAGVTRSWDLRCADFEETINGAGLGCTVFADPPYSGTFGAYTSGGFTDADQVRLADALALARDRGAAVLHTNSDTPEIRKLYRDRGFWLLPTAELRSVNRDGDGRARVGCLIVSDAPELLAAPDDGGTA